jgi:asparagine synthase (glutamine-hydrolysing)
METPDGRYSLSYNGEVYNFRELRQELEELGYQFRSRTDTEVVLYALVHWGPDAIQKFNGMFAFALWDNKEKALLLARDRYGIKPLYYAWHGRALIFASEIKALLKVPGFSPKVDRKGLLEYMTFQNFFSDRTIFENVRMLPAGHFWYQEIEGPQSQPKKYWDFCFQEPADGGLASIDEYAEELEHLFVRAVKRQLVSDTEVGSYLSGGMDSASIAAVAATELPYLKTFTVGFDLHSASGLELAFDEREKAEHLSYIYKTEHYEMVLKAGDMERCLSALARHIEEPRVGQSYPNYYAAKLASKFCKVVLSGTGGDELFAGYPWRYYSAVVNDSFDHYASKYYKTWHRLLPNAYIKKVFAPIWSEVKDVWTEDIFKTTLGGNGVIPKTPEDYVNQSLYLEAKTFMHGLLVIEDKISMAHGLETRVPFLDNDLVDFAMRLPVRTKLGNLQKVVEINENEPGAKTQKYFEKTRDGKLILRKVFSKFVPEIYTDGIKQGFSAPDASWFKGDSIEFVRRKLLQSHSPIYDYLDQAEISRLIDDHMSGRSNRRLLIWSLLNLDALMSEVEFDLPLLPLRSQNSRFPQPPAGELD